MAAAPSLSDTQTRAWRGFQRMAVGVAGRLHRRLVESAGISLSDFEVLSALAGAEARMLRAYELGQELQWEKSRLSHHLKRMEGRGLVDRKICESDGRGLWVSLTDAGSEAWTRGGEAHEEEIRRLVFDRLDNAQVSELMGISDVVLLGLPDELCD